LHAADELVLAKGSSFLALVCDLGRRLALANPTFENPLNGAGVVLMIQLFRPYSRLSVRLNKEAGIIEAS
jgi:hypothetical protein